jgi:glyoxylase-like metal-dependent hydrolase (beta-lactamase superfamily II)
VIHTPGHTAGHHSVALEERGVLFSGDAMASFDYVAGTRGVGQHRFNDDRELALASLARLDPIDAKVVLFGHGDPWTGGLPRALEIARKRARELGRKIDLRVGDAQALDFPDASFDTVICTLALCTIPDDRAAVSEAKRVLRPGGRFLLLEHVRSPVPSVRLGQRLLEPLMLRFEGDHLLREPLEHLRAEEFAIERLLRSKLGIVERIAARKPPQPS